MTRKGKGKKRIFNAKKSTDWIILIVLIFVIFLAVSMVYFASAISRDDLAKTKSTIAEMQKKLASYDKKISDQKQIIKTNESNLAKAKEDVKIKKQQFNESYKAFEALEKAKQAVTNAENKLVESNQKLQQLINEKNKLKSDIINLQDKLTKDEIQIKKQELPDFATYPRLIGITLSQSCITMLKEHIPTTCPPPEILIQLDSSNTKVSGEFVYVNGLLQRNSTEITNSFKWYEHDKQIRIIYDPPFDTSQRIQMIEIKPNFDVYYLRNDKTIHDNQTDFARILYHDRYIDNCKHATINSDKYQMLLPDTIYHMRLGCTPQSTQFNEKEIIYPEYSEIDLSTSNWYKYLAWLDNVTKHCIFKYKQCQD